MTDDLLKVEDLSVGYLAPDAVIFLALEEISFSLSAGEIMGIMGESGAGKTTLGLALMGLHRPGAIRLRGEITFDGSKLSGLEESSLCRIRGSGLGMIFQDARGSLDPSMPVLKQVEELIRMYGGGAQSEVREEALVLLGGMGITPDILEMAPFAHQLSGGLCQRAAIAMALACKPSVLIADEPTSSLDTVTQGGIVSLLLKERENRGLAIIFISHDLPLVASFADNILVLSHGRIMEQNTAENILNNPRSEYTRKLLSSWQKLTA